jgi:hypothetical protein
MNAPIVKYTTHESEVRILYEYLAEASVVFPKVFPVIHSLLDAKITNVLSLCHDKTILAAVQSIIENMIACEDEKSQQQLHFLQVLKVHIYSRIYSINVLQITNFFFLYFSQIWFTNFQSRVIKIENLNSALVTQRLIGCLPTFCNSETMQCQKRELSRSQIIKVSKLAIFIE